MCISKERARFTTSRPMLPRPTMPSVFWRSSLPRNFFFSHLPLLVDRLACGMERASESIRARVCSATETAFPPGVFITRTPAAVAAGRSTLSTPTPARPMAFNFGALASMAALTFTALRTSKASASARCCSYSFGLETTTSQPGCSFSNLTPAAASGSATSIFMRGLDRGRFFSERHVRVNVLHGGDTFAKRNRQALRRENDLKLRDHREQIREIEITEVRDAENLTFHRSLAVGNDRAEAVAEFLHDDAGIEALRRADSRDGRGWRVFGERLHAEFGNRVARGFREQLRVLDQLIHADALHVFQRFGKCQNQRGGWRPARFAVGGALALLLQIEIEPRKLGLRFACPGFLARRQEREARRNHEGFLRTADHDVEAPAVDVERHRAEPRDRIDDEDSVGLLDEAGHRLHVVLRAGGGFRCLHENATSVRIRFQRFSNALRRDHVAVFGGEQHGIQTERLGQIHPTLAEFS